MDKKIEIRTFPIEFRADKENRKIFGYAALFDELSSDLGGFQEKIARGAFLNTIQNDDIRFLFNHDPNYVLGRSLNKTLTLEEDEKGLRIEATPPETSFANDLIKLLERGDIDQMSFAFKVNKDGEKWEHRENDLPTRILVDTTLFDVSIVVYPAYDQTSVNVRSTKEVFSSYQKELDELQKDKSGSEKRWQDAISIRRKRLQLIDKQ